MPKGLRFIFVLTAGFTLIALFQNFGPATLPLSPASLSGLYVYIDPGVSPARLYLDARTGRNRSVVADYEAAAARPYVDGVLLINRWNVLEPQPGQYEWLQPDSALNKWVTKAVREHKKISIGVMAGVFTPPWIYQAPFNVPAVFFQQDGNRGFGEVRCISRQVPVVWHTSYLSRYNKMMKDLASHLQSLQVPGFPKSAALDAIRIVKVNGINLATEELALGANAPADERCPDNIDSAWAAAGFTPVKAVRAWEILADGLASAFPGKVLSVDVLGGQMAFPSLGDDGRPEISQGPLDPTTLRILDSGLTKFRGRLSVQWDALNARPGVSAVEQAVMDYKSRGAFIGWQTNGRAGFDGSGCGEKLPFHSCQLMMEYWTILRAGLLRRSSFIEVFAPNVIDFPAVLTKAQERLSPQ